MERQKGPVFLEWLFVVLAVSCAVGPAEQDAVPFRQDGTVETAGDLPGQRDGSGEVATYPDSGTDGNPLNDVFEPDLCAPDCVEKKCGPDGCGGECGHCDAGHACEEGQCICVPDCMAKACGPDSCGGQCGSCDDNDICTDDVCDDGTCQHSSNFAPCDDGNPCTGNDKCHAGVCSGVTLPQAELVEIGCVCHGDSDCQALDDGDPCNGTLYCGTEGRNAICAVVSGSVPDCDDGIPCTLDTCAPYVGCESLPDDSQGCSNGDPCDGKETCDNGECVEGPDLVCEDGDSCTSDSCVPMTGCVYVPDPDFCEDGLDCTTHTCQDSVCETTLLPGFCIIDKMCKEPGYQNPVNLCQACLPDESNDSWTYLDDGEPCAPGKVCHDNKCCQPDCGDFLCGPDGCGGSCGVCQDGWSCQAGGCVEGPCVPDCAGKECGGDGCQGSCGECPTPLVCDGGVCKKIEPYHIWSKRFGGNGPVEGTALAIDQDGSVVVAGRFDADVVDFGCSPLEKELHHDVFVVKLDSEGTCLWSEAFATGWTSNRTLAVDVDEQGNIYLAGSFTADTLQLGDVPLVNAGACCEGIFGGDLPECNDVFMAKLDYQGQHLWTKGFGGCKGDMTLDLELAVDGAIRLRTLAASISVDYGGGPLETPGSGLAQHVSMFSQSGDHMWSTSAGQGGWATLSGAGMECDVSGCCLLTGGFTTPWELGGETLVANGYPDNCVPGGSCYDGYIVKVNSEGNVSWTIGQGGLGWDIFSDVSMGPDGTATAVGHFRFADTMVGEEVLELSVDSDLLVFSVAPDGTTGWILHGTGPQLLKDVKVDSDLAGQIYVGSTFKGLLELGPFKVGPGYDANASTDVSLFRISQDGEVVWGGSFGSDGYEDLDCVSVDAAQNIYLVASTTSSALQFGGPNLESIAQSQDLVVVKLGQQLVAP